MVSGSGFALQAVRIVLGFILALVGAGVFLVFGFFQALTADSEPGVAVAVIAAGLVSSALIGALAFVPACFAIVLAESFRWRSAVYHIAIGGLIAFVIWGFGETSAGNAGDNAALRPGTTIALAAGFVAGAIYWLVAGRLSGTWHRPEQGA
ncbi:translation initiation factor IF-3 [Pannonibacter carbonis]|uniref:translation initiation factor IF-3 n=1 Tax=Pannonibacter carbonis TaxID=2067569 RepID=UPI000D0E8C08|nr:translation initiation factor IF-3 [Pannonibacter carbonis]